MQFDKNTTYNNIGCTLVSIKFIQKGTPIPYSSRGPKYQLGPKRHDNRKKTNQKDLSTAKHSSIIYGPSRMCMKMGQPL